MSVLNNGEAKARTGVAPPDDSEWDFSALTARQCSNDGERAELRAAIYYEYARESDSIRKLVEEYAALPKKLRLRLEKFTTSLLAESADWGGSVSRRLALMHFIPFKNCILWPEFFPQTPWLKIPSPMRAARVAQFVKAHPPGYLLQINEHDPRVVFERPAQTVQLRTRRLSKAKALEMKSSKSTERWRFFSGGVEHLLVSVNWSLGNNSEIAARFHEWLNDQRPANYPEPRTDASRENVTAALLERLKVMRLLSVYPWKNVAGIVSRGQSDAGALRKDVHRDMRRIFRSEAFATGGETSPLIPTNELPLNYATHTERKRKRQI